MIMRSIQDRQKCICKVTHTEAIILFIMQYYDRIKASIIFGKLRVLFNIFKGCVRYPLLLAVGDIFHGRRDRVIGSGFYFDKDELLIFFHNKINLSKAAAEVPAQQSIALPYEMLSGDILTDIGQILFRVVRHGSRKSLTD